MTPILTVPCASALPGRASNARAAALLRIDRLCIGFLLRLWLDWIAFLGQWQGWARLPVGRLLRSGGLEYCTQSMDFQLSRKPLCCGVAPGSGPIEASQHLRWNG